MLTRDFACCPGLYLNSTFAAKGFKRCPDPCFIVATLTSTNANVRCAGLRLSSAQALTFRYCLPPQLRFNVSAEDQAMVTRLPDIPTDTGANATYQVRGPAGLVRLTH